MVLCCAVACGPPSVAVEGGDEIAMGETSVGDSDSDNDGSDSNECPPPPDVISCWSGNDCPDGFKCHGYSGEDCSGTSFGSTACVPILGDQGLGQNCTTSVENPTPSFTWYLDDCNGEGLCMEHGRGSHEGTCVPYCEWENEMVSSCADPQRLCTGGFPLCLQRCDPTAAEDPCEGEFVCGSYQFSKTEFYCASGGFNPGEGLLGDGCVSAFGCVDGLGCVAGELLPDCSDTSCCSPFCSLVDVDPCAELGPGFTCVPFYDPGEAPPPLEHVGLCASP